MIPLPDVATDVVPSVKAVEQLKLCAKAMLITRPGSDVEVLRESLVSKILSFNTFFLHGSRCSAFGRADIKCQCFRPVTSSGRPIISRISDDILGGVKTQRGAQGGVFIAAGHGAWGISHAPGTGMVLAELIEGRETSAKIDALKLPS